MEMLYEIESWIKCENYLAYDLWHPESMTHLEDKDMRHEVELPDSTIAVTEESVDFIDALYLENCANSSVDIETVFSEDERTTIDCSVTIFATRLR